MSYHSNMMSEYYAAREAQEQRAQAYSWDYEKEKAHFYEFVEPKLTLKDFLTQRKSSEQEPTRTVSQVMVYEPVPNYYQA